LPGSEGHGDSCGCESQRILDFKTVDPPSKCFAIHFVIRFCDSICDSFFRLAAGGMPLKGRGRIVLEHTQTGQNLVLANCFNQIATPFANTNPLAPAPGKLLQSKCVSFVCGRGCRAPCGRAGGALYLDGQDSEYIALLLPGCRTFAINWFQCVCGARCVCYQWTQLS